MYGFPPTASNGSKKTKNKTKSNNRPVQSSSRLGIREILMSDKNDKKTKKGSKKRAVNVAEPKLSWI